MKDLQPNKKIPTGTLKGQSLAEYGLVLALVAVVAIGGLQMLGASIQTQLISLGGALSLPASETSTAPTATGGGSGGGASSPPATETSTAPAATDGGSGGGASSPPATETSTAPTATDGGSGGGASSPPATETSTAPTATGGCSGSGSGCAVSSSGGF